MHLLMRKILGIQPTYEQAAAQNATPPSPQLLPDQLYYLQPRERTFFNQQQMTLRVKNSFLITHYPRFWYWQGHLKTTPLAIWAISFLFMVTIFAGCYYHHHRQQSHEMALAQMSLHHAHEQLQALIASAPQSALFMEKAAPHIQVMPYVAPPKEQTQTPTSRRTRYYLR